MVADDTSISKRSDLLCAFSWTTECIYTAYLVFTDVVVSGVAALGVVPRPVRAPHLQAVLLRAARRPRAPPRREGEGLARVSPGPGALLRRVAAAEPPVLGGLQPSRQNVVNN